MSKFRVIKSVSRQRGFSLVASIFILVVLGVLGAYMVTIGTTQRVTVSYAVQGARANQAARSGIEWGIYQAVCSGSCLGSTPVNPSGPGLEGFAVTVNCIATPHQEGGGPAFNVFQISSVAQSGTFGDPYFFSRQIEIRVTDASGICP